MGNVHHTHDRSFETAKSREDMAHRLLTPDGNALRSTRGFAALKGSQPAVDIQPRHGGVAKAGVVEHSWGNTEQQIQQDGTRHLIDGAPDASSASPLDTLSASQYGKRIAKPAIHSSMTRTPHTDSGDQMLTEAVQSGSTELPAAVHEEDCNDA